MSEYDDNVNQQSRDPDQGATCTPAVPAPAPAVAAPAPQSPEGHEPTEHSDISDAVSVVHGGVEVTEVAAEMAKYKGLGVTPTLASSGIAIAETVHSAVTGEGCAGDKAMGIVPLMGPASAVMMPSWCGPGPAEQKSSDTGMTPSQEKAAGYQTPADPNAPAVNPVVPHFQTPGQ